MKITKILALAMAICMLAVCFIACDGGNSTDTTPDTTAESAVEMTITLIVKADSKEQFKGEVTCNGNLGDAIEKFTFMQSDFEGDCFDENDILKTVCGITAGDKQSWIAYFQDDGKDKGRIESIRSQGPATDKEKGLTDGCTIVLDLE